ncbi:MAG: 4-hydroxy-tetrahydrodipicolinate synthase [Rikenellaceae bacterium]
MKVNNIVGTGVALVTPFDQKGEIDFVSLESLVDYVIDSGVEYIVALGTTAESATMTKQEKHAVQQCIIKQTASRVPIVLGLGDNNTAKVVEELMELDTNGIDAILSVTPYYNKPSQEGLYQHYKALSEASPLPIILYNVPSRTGVNMTAQTTLRLACDFENIMGIKEASADMTQMSYILRDRPEGFMVYSGDDATAMYAVSMGADGVISVAANAFAKEFSTMIRDAAASNMAAASKTHLELIEAVEALFCEGNPVGVKMALEIMGKCSSVVRLPLVCGSESLKNKLTQLIG